MINSKNSHLIKRFTYSLIIILALLLRVQASESCVHYTIGKKHACLEIANTFELRRYGLMHRTHLEENNGMLFIYKNPISACFWMKDTPIDLDIAFATKDQKIVSIQSMKKNTLSRHCTDQKVIYAIEMNKDWFKRNQINIGDQFFRSNNNMFMQPIRENQSH